MDRGTAQGDREPGRVLLAGLSVPPPQLSAPGCCACVLPLCVGVSSGLSIFLGCCALFSSRPSAACMRLCARACACVRVGSPSSPPPPASSSRQEGRGTRRNGRMASAARRKSRHVRASSGCARVLLCLAHSAVAPLLPGCCLCCVFLRQGREYRWARVLSGEAAVKDVRVRACVGDGTSSYTLEYIYLYVSVSVGRVGKGRCVGGPPPPPMYILYLCLGGSWFLVLLRAIFSSLLRLLPLARSPSPAITPHAHTHALPPPSL